MIDSFTLDLRARNLARGTVSLYVDSAHRFGSWLRDNGDPHDWSAVTEETIKRYVVHLLGIYAAGYANNQYRALQQFFKWYAAEEDAPNPMGRLTPPKAGSKLVPVFKDDEL
jgi:integrase/recombinase XerD